MQYPPPPLAGSSDSSGIPGEYRDGVSWLLNGLSRHPAACAVALIAGWTGISFALWGAVAGAIVGLCIGLGVDIHLLGLTSRIGGGRAVSVVTALAGIGIGAVVGLVAVLAYFFRNPLSLMGSLISGAIVSIGIVIVTAVFERTGLRLRGYRHLSIEESRRIAPLVKDVADAMGLTALPRFAIDDSGKLPGAWAHMRTIVLTRGALHAWTDLELQAVLVHELHHWRKGDSVGLRCVWAAAWPIAITYNLGAFIATGRPPIKTEDGKLAAPQPAGSGSIIRAIVGWGLFWPAWVMTRVVIAPLQASSQRRYEYEADAAAGALGFGPYLISALQRIEQLEWPRTGWEAAMTRSHPPMVFRIEALQLRRPDDEPYRESELKVDAWAALRRLFGGGYGR